MDVLVNVAIGVVAFGLGMAAMAGIGAVVRKRRGATDPLGHGHQPPPQPSPPPPPMRGVFVNDADLDGAAGVILRLIEDGSSSVEQQDGRMLRGQLGMDLIAPREEEPVDPGQHSVEGTVRTADPVRHGTVAYLLHPGLRVRGGRVIRPARVKRYEYTYQAPRGSALAPPPQPAPPMGGAQFGPNGPGRPVRGPDPSGRTGP